MTLSQHSLDVTILLTTWNGKDLLRAALTSVRETTSGVSTEIIVVDDASTDGTADMVREEFPDVHLRVLRENVGFVRANNIGAASASGRYLFLLNTDTILVNNAVGILASYLDRQARVGVCGAWLRNRDLSSQISYGSFPSFSQALVDAFFLNDLFPSLHLPNRGRAPSGSRDAVPRAVDYVTGAALLTRRDLVQRLGLFDEQFEAYCEEVDFCHRVHTVAGLATHFVPDAHIIHLGGGSYGNVSRRRVRIQFQSYNTFLRKHHGAVYAWGTRLLYAWHYAVKLLVRAFQAMVTRGDAQRLAMSQAWYALRYSLAPGTRRAGP
jgi:GT2 family glycosyltransferase